MANIRHKEMREWDSGEFNSKRVLVCSREKSSEDTPSARCCFLEQKFNLVLDLKTLDGAWLVFLVAFPQCVKDKNWKKNFEFNTKILTEKVVPNIANERAKNDA